MNQYGHYTPTTFTVMDIEIDNLLCTNCIYVGPSEYDQFMCDTRYVQLVEFKSGHVFEIASADFVAIGHVALNSYQRKSLHVKIGDCVQIQLFKIQPVNVVNLWIKMTSNSRPITILFEKFTLHFRKTYWGHVFCNGQIVLVEFDQCFFEVVTYVDQRTTLDEFSSIKCMFDISNPLLTLGEDEENGDDGKTDDDDVDLHINIDIVVGSGVGGVNIKQDIMQDTNDVDIQMTKMGIAYSDKSLFSICESDMSDCDMISGQMRHEISGQMRHEISGQMRHEISGQMRNEISDQMRHEMSNQMRHEISGVIKGQMRHEISGEIIGDIDDWSGL